MAEVAEVNGRLEEAGMLADLSRDLLKVAERIQAELDGIGFDIITPEVLSKVEAAEDAVDVLAQDLSRGAGELTEWHRALIEYESAWHQVIASLGARRN
ncbi:MAG: cob(I)alamin adenosyltransferase [Candidatus Latescibacterota bacterium]|jgi:cob(I)alamin adenosyltransferase